MPLIQLIKIILVLVSIIMFCLTGSNTPNKAWWSYGLACLVIFISLELNLFS